MGQDDEVSETAAPKDEAQLLVDRAKVAETTREEMEALAAKVRDLVLRQPPIQLLGYLLAQFHLVMMLTPGGSEDEPRPNKDAIRAFQFALEYVHAVWSSYSTLPAEHTPFDENTAGELMNALGQLQDKTMWYCMASSGTQTEFHAKSTWAMIRGHRYQVLEEDFFRFVLEPHDAALREAYGISFADIAKGIQSISDTFRAGFSQAVETIKERMDDTYEEVESSGESLGAVLERRRAKDSSFGSELSGLFRDLFFGGVCNLSRHSNLPQSLLEDLSYEPGQNSDFFADGPFAGTPMRTLPARVKPGIKLGTDFYATDGQFVRDSAYRAIQWGLWRRLPYRDEWLKRQGRAIEQAYPLVFVDQLRGAQTIESVFFKDVHTGHWVETDLLIILADVLFVIEAKAGVMPMQSPATNFASHERVVQELIVKAYEQCKRFLDYLASAATVVLYKLIEGDYVETSRLSKTQFRLILPIGLTVEAFTPFSAMAKELPGVEPILGKYPFISMSVDDLFVLKRFLPTTGELLHYLEVRQRVARLKGALLFDESDHLGAYIAKNRFDMDISEQLKEADQVTWDGFSDKVDHHFEGEAWRTTPPPSQSRPGALISILEELDRLRPINWLRLDSTLRSFGHDGPENIARYLDQLIPTLAEHPRRRFQIGEDPPLQFWLCHANATPSAQEVQYQGQVGCLTVSAPEMQVIILGYSRPGEVASLRCEIVHAPSILQTDYPALLAEAERQRIKMIKLDQG